MFPMNVSASGNCAFHPKAGNLKNTDFQTKSTRRWLPVGGRRHESAPARIHQRQCGTGCTRAAEHVTTSQCGSDETSPLHARMS